MKTKILKSLFCIVLSLICLVSGGSVAFANAPTAFTFCKVSCEPNQEVAVPLIVENNTGMACFRFRITYNTKALSLINVEQGADLNAGTFVYDSDVEKETVTFLWYNTINITAQGEIALLKFKVITNTEEVLPLTVTWLPQDILDQERNPLNSAVNSGSVSVIKPVTYVLGDINGDTKIDAKDALMALKFAVGKAELTDVQKLAGEVDGKEGINAGDALQILRFSVNKITQFPIETK